MKISTYYSHLNGWEYLQVHKPKIWQEIVKTIESVDAPACKTKVSKEKRMVGKMLYSPRAMNDEFRKSFHKLGWKESRTNYWVTADDKLARKTLNLTPAAQKALIQESGATPIMSYNQTDFVKQGVAVEVQFGKYAFVAYDLFVKHLAFYVGNLIDVGVEILPMKSLQQQMSSGPSYYEGELYNLIREGRGVPGVPLVIVGIEC